MAKPCPESKHCYSTLLQSVTLITVSLSQILLKQQLKTVCVNPIIWLFHQNACIYQGFEAMLDGRTSCFPDQQTGIFTYYAHTPLVSLHQSRICTFCLNTYLLESGRTGECQISLLHLNVSTTNMTWSWRSSLITEREGEFILSSSQDLKGRPFWEFSP